MRIFTFKRVEMFVDAVYVTNCQTGRLRCYFENDFATKNYTTDINCKANINHTSTLVYIVSFGFLLKVFKYI